MIIKLFSSQGQTGRRPELSAGTLLTLTCLVQPLLSFNVLFSPPLLSLDFTLDAECARSRSAARRCLADQKRRKSKGWVAYLFILRPKQIGSHKE